MRPRLAVGAVVLAALATIASAADDPRRSGFSFMSRETQAMQTDDTANPGMLWVADGERLWGEKAGAANLACADCHGDATTTMKGVAARYPAWSQAKARPIDLQGRVNECRQDRQRAAPLPAEHKDLLALTAFVGRQSRGMPIASPAEPRLDPYRKAGEALYNRRIGQLNFSCAQCHDDNAGRRLASAPIPEAHPTGYPLYRLEWQDMGSVQRRIRGCMVGVRAEPYPYGADEFVDLELFLMGRAQGLPVETPAVRP